MSTGDASGTSPRGRRPTLLVVDDEPSILGLVERVATPEGFDVVAIGDGTQTLAWLRPGLADAALVDLRMPGIDGLDVLAAIHRVDPACQVILMTGHPSVDSAIEAVRTGALDYVQKPFDVQRLGALLAGVREALDQRQAVLAAEAALARRVSCCGMIGRSAVMQEVFATIRRVAMHARVVLVTGETGTGKELVAAALHAQGSRAARRFVTVNCSALVEPLFESEVFGHARGAFTGAIADKPGLFEAADGGTLVLDEIGELPAAPQAKLLRTLESGEVLRVGATSPRTVDVHVVATTNRELLDEVRCGRFRSDLYYRLHVIQLRLPPLRDRMEDLPYLTAAFIEEFSRRFGKSIRGLTRTAEHSMLCASWPGNVRELRNTIERACMIAEGPQLTVRDLGLGLQDEQAPDVPAPGSLAEVERDRIVQVLDECGGNKAESARRLGLNRRSMYRRLERYGLGGGSSRRE